MARTKGAVSLVSMPLEELQRHFKPTDVIVVGRKFLEGKGISPMPSIPVSEEKPIFEILDYGTKQPNN